MVVFAGQHQREVFLFNDILVITKIHSRRKNSVTYTFRGSHALAGMMVTLFENNFYSYGISLSQRWDRKVVITLNARNDHDRSVEAAVSKGSRLTGNCHYQVQVCGGSA